MLQTWILAAFIAAGGVVIFVLDRDIYRHQGSPVSYLFIFAMVGAAYYFGLEGLLGAVVLGIITNGIHAFATRQQSTAETAP